VLFTVVTRTRYRSPSSVITTIATVIAAIIIVGIVWVPFQDLFPQDNPRQDILVNWGIAAIAYLILGAIIARLARR
jgi:hypothetical protein